MIRRALVGLLSCAAVLVSGSAYASPDAGQEIPRGWFAGTIVVEAQWDRIDSERRMRGSATLKIDRTGPETASYELEYREENHWRETAFDPACRGKLAMVTTSSFKKTAQIHVVVREVYPRGVSFYVVPREGASVLLAPLTGQSARDCETGELWPPSNAGDTHISIGFATPQPATAETRQGTAALGINSFGVFGSPTPGAVNRATATYDLRLVRVVLPPGPPTRLAINRDAASVSPFVVRRGSKVRATLGKPRLLDANGTTIATSGVGGCDVTYYKGNRVKLASRSIRGSWTPTTLACSWQVPRTGPVARAIATKNVDIYVAPWVSRGGKRFWARAAGDHAVFIKRVERD